MKADHSMENYIRFGDKEKLKIIIVDSPKITAMSEAQREYLLSLKGKRINDLPAAGAYLQNKCILENVIIDEGMIYYSFILDTEMIKIQENRPVKIVTNQKIECIHLIDYNTLLLKTADNINIRNLTCLIVLIPEAINIKVNPSTAIRYHKPQISEFELGPIEMEVMKSFLSTMLEIRIENELELEQAFDINNLLIKSSEIKQEINIKAATKSKGKLIQFSYKDSRGHNNKLTINCKGEVQCSVNISSKLAAEIGEIIYLLSRIDVISEYLVSFESNLGDFFEAIHKDMEEEGKLRQKRLIISELMGFINSLLKVDKNQVSLSITYVTVTVNLLIALCKQNKATIDLGNKCDDIEFLEYSNLINFIRLYVNKSFSVNKSEENVINALSVLGNMIRKYGIREDKVVEFLEKELICSI